MATSLPELVRRESSAEDILQGDILCRIFRYLEWREIVKVRLVGPAWKVVSTATSTEEEVYIDNGTTLQGVAECLPNLQSMRLDQNTASTGLPVGNSTRLALLPRFVKLQHFKCLHHVNALEWLEFRDSISCWQHLQTLNLHGCEELYWELSDIAHLPHLHDVRCINNRYVTGSVQDLLTMTTQEDGSSSSTVSSPLFHNLTILDISGCSQVTGTLREFAALPQLKWLGIARTRITGDLRCDIQPGSFVSIEGMGLDNDKVYGAARIDRVGDAAAVMRARIRLIKQSTWESPLYPLLVHLSPDASEYHERLEQRLYSSERDPPFSLETVVVGHRRGWRWSNYLGGFCDTHWLDPEPKEDCTLYQAEFAEFQKQQEASMFSGFLDPPTPNEYRALCRDRL
ncbi:expressed unknown protein [Seminavis robusta]|uniref:F-box domain-containing protein n=1 Tax=Seminavis robusta TaxID=568900 RepID=A0A9N8H2J1_9STRA|nr:expressed unknown protein [Seminavis robusta]|eukprot:Sro20_g013910.1 n/a (399) ;mRNA; r:33535-34731